MAAPQSLRELIDQVPAELQQEVADFVLFVLERHVKSQPLPSQETGTLALLAQKALEADISTGETDIAEHSREILQGQYAEHLSKRMNDRSMDGE